MSVDFYWRIPTGGDKGDIRTPFLNRGDFAATRRASLAPGLRTERSHFPKNRTPR